MGIAQLSIRPLRPCPRAPTFVPEVASAVAALQPVSRAIRLALCPAIRIATGNCHHVPATTTTTTTQPPPPPHGVLPRWLPALNVPLEIHHVVVVVVVLL